MSEKRQRPRISFVSAARREASLAAARRLAFESDWVAGAPGLRRSKLPMSAHEREAYSASSRVEQVVAADRAAMIARSRASVRQVEPVAEESDAESGD